MYALIFHFYFLIFYLLMPATLLKLTLLHGCFSRFLNCTNATKSLNAPHIYSIINPLTLTAINE